VNRELVAVGALGLLGAAAAYWFVIRPSQQSGTLSFSLTGNSDVNNNWSSNSVYQSLKSVIDSASSAFSLPDNLLANLLGTESSYKPSIISGQQTSAAGAVGIAQFMPGTASQYGVDSTDPTSAIPGAANMLSDLYNQFGNWQYAVAAYNWGSGNVSKWLASGKTTPVPAETQNYVLKITGSALA
jgi:soluble lytic murein transglycosylase-like protein